MAREELNGYHRVNVEGPQEPEEQESLHRQGNHQPMLQETWNFAAAGLPLVAP